MKKGGRLSRSNATVLNVRPQVYGAGDGTRTRDLAITNRLLYQLSYTGKKILKFYFKPRVLSRVFDLFLTVALSCCNIIVF